MRDNASRLNLAGEDFDRELPPGANYVNPFRRQGMRGAGGTPKKEESLDGSLKTLEPVAVQAEPKYPEGGRSRTGD